MSSSPAEPQGSSLPFSPADNILTPSRKVQALLAQFDDSDSDDAHGVPKRNPIIANGRSDSISPESEEDSQEEDDAPVARPSRMLARLQGTTYAAHSAQHQDTLAAHEQTQTLGQDAAPAHVESSEDELSRPQPRKRLLLKRKSSPTAPSSPEEDQQPPQSPLFFPSPTVHQKLAPPRSPANSVGEVENSNNHQAGAGAKFKALVEKHRKARIEKEAAEAAKLAAPSSNDKTAAGSRPRGSSPADDSDEGSDESTVNAARRLTKDTKPTRKASKRAMEELKRETQRMSRNMQLAHQARTKKKITKESLLAKFNFSVPTPPKSVDVSGDQSATASSDVGSDAEQRQGQETPPTSPIEDDTFDTKTPAIRKSEMDHNADLRDLADIIVEPPSLQNLGMDAPQDSNKGKGKASDWLPQDSVQIRHVTQDRPVTLQSKHANSAPKKFSNKATVLQLLKRKRVEEDHDADDLDVITAKGSVRKYAAFEKLPKRKAQETRSHLALRSLAQLYDSERNHRSASELTASLRRVARMQAHEERQQKIAELKAKGVIIQTAEERERDQQEVEDLVERARQEAAEISKREKALAKKDGTFVKDGLDDDDESDDEEFVDDPEDAASEPSEPDSEDGDDEDEDEDEENAVDSDDNEHGLFDDQADEGDNEESEAELEGEPKEMREVEQATHDRAAVEDPSHRTPAPRNARTNRIIADDDDDDEVERPAAESSILPQPTKTPQSLTRSARKQIPGFQMSDDLPIGLTQAFAATMADSQSQDEENTQQQDSLAMLQDLPSPNIAFAPKLNRLESLDLITDSQPASQTQPLNINLAFSQSQHVPESPSLVQRSPANQFTPSNAFALTQDVGYMLTPFKGSRYASETPKFEAPHSTVDTVIMPPSVDASPIMQRKGRLQRGRVRDHNSDEEAEDEAAAAESAFAVMRKAAKKAQQPDFDKSKSKARDIVDEAAEESDDEYAGLGGASDDDGNDQENEDDREMIDHDTQVGKGDEAKLAGLFADRERKTDEAAVSKLLKDITTGALRRKRGAHDDLDLSDEEDAVSRRREAKRREFAKMRRELLKDEAVGKIAEDKRKEAFLRSIEDREPVSDDDDEPAETAQEESQDASQIEKPASERTDSDEKSQRPLEPTSNSQLNRLPASSRRTTHSKKPSTLAEIRDSVSFLIEEPDSQANVVDVGLSDSDSEPEAYVNLDRHLKSAEADENAAFEDELDEELDDFIIDDDGLAKDKFDSQESIFKKPSLPSQTSLGSFSSRRTNTNVVNRLSLLRQSSSTASAPGSTKLAFHSTATTTGAFKAPSLLRRATTNSSFSSVSSDNVSATGVTTLKPERSGQEKEFIRKGSGGRRNAVNYRPSVREEKMSARAGVQKQQLEKKGRGGVKGGFLGGLFGSGSWG